MAKLLIPSNIIEKMVCTTCKNYLSFFPIYVKDDESGGICGRCKITEEDKYLHDIAYENLAKYLAFPCRYKSTGCEEELTPPNLINHESSCTYRKIRCPTKGHTKCQWEGACNSVKTHFETEHDGLLLKNNEFELNFVNAVSETALIYFNDEVFLVKKDVDTCVESFSCSVICLKLKETSENYDYFLRLTSENKAYTHKLPKKSTTKENNFTKFNNNLVKEKLKNPTSITVSVVIIQSNDSDVEEEVLADIKKDPNIQWDLLNELECPICFDFMLPPIYQCVKGHSICSACKPKITTCPYCKNDIADTKNFVLEKMSQHLTFPCKFFKSGCQRSAKAADIKSHEMSCEFGPYQCPLKEIVDCQNKSRLSEIINHVDNNHDDYVLKSDMLSFSFDRDQTREHFYLMKFSDNVFKLHFQYSNNKFLWSLQLVGPPTESKNYKFEVDVVDSSKNDRRFYIRGLCIPLTEKANSFEDPSKYLMLILDQVEPFIIDKFTYYIRIMKV